METKTYGSETHYRTDIRLYDDTTTWLAEILPGVMRTPFEYKFDGNELYSRDGTPIGSIFTKSITEAERMVDEQPNMLFELRRRHIEQQEYHAMIDMMNGELPNTMVVISDYPPELMNYPHSIGGYNHERKQTMLRVLTREDNNILRMYSQSLDKSDRRALEAIYNQFGITPQAGELLGQRIYLHLDDTQRDTIVDKITGIYDRELSEQYGGSWYAGLRMTHRNNINTYEFVKSQTDLLAAAMARARGGNIEPEVMYGLAAAMKARFMRIVSGNFDNIEPATVQRYANPFEEMYMAGQTAATRGQRFDGCGLSITARNGNAVMDELESSGYGNLSNKGESYSFSKYMYCVVCQAPPKKEEKRKMCGPCGICKNCDTRLQQKK